MNSPFLTTFLIFALAPLLAPAQERPDVYPFDVTVGGQKAVFDEGFPIFAKIPDPVAANSEVTLAAAPEAVIVNVFPCDERGTPTPGVEPKVILGGKATTFKLDKTMDKSVLAPGLYGMNIVLRSKGTARVMFTVGEAAALAGGASDQSTPEKTLAAVFAAAKSGDLASLKALVPASGDLDGDVERIRDVADAEEAAQKEFKEWFSTGRLEGKAQIDGDKAEVYFYFGPKGTRDETMNLVRKDGKWYLDSF